MSVTLPVAPSRCGIDTVELARELLPDIRIVTQHGPGKGAALRTGFEAATGDHIGASEVGSSHQPKISIKSFQQRREMADSPGQVLVNVTGIVDTKAVRWKFVTLWKRLL